MMVVKRLRRSAPGICLFLMSTLLLMRIVEESPRRGLPSASASEYVIFWRHGKPLEDGRYPGEYVPFVVVPVEEERLLDMHLEESVALTRLESRVVPRLRPPESTSLHYTPRFCFTVVFFQLSVSNLHTIHLQVLLHRNSFKSVHLTASRTKLAPPLTFISTDLPHEVKPFP